jgi:C4-dicarboxylate transporter DctM subunit
MSALFLVLSVIVLLLLGVPVAISLGLSSILYIVLFSIDSMSSIALKLYEANEHFLLLAIPFFILSSTFMSSGGEAKRIVRFALACVGHFRGGLAIAGVFACMIFAALSGSSPATVVAIGTIVIAGMQRAGYPLPFASGVIANAGTLGILIPPSIVMVVYAAATDVSVGRLFMAGVIPGLMAGSMLMIAIYIYAVRTKLPAQKWQGFAEVLSAGKGAFSGLLMIFIILGGIYGGIFTPTEAAAVAAVYAYFVANFIYRDIGPLKGKGFSGTNISTKIINYTLTTSVYFVIALFHKDNRKILYEASRVTIMLMFIIANALLFAHVLSTERIPQNLAELILDAGFEWWSFLIIVNLMLLIGGQFMEPSGLLLIVAPLVFPIAMKLGIDPVHLGVIMVVNMEIGMVTPPIGLNLFVTSGVTNMRMTEVIRASTPLMLVLFAFLILVTYVPAISTFLPNLLMGKS